VKVKIKRLTETALIPTYAKPGDACFDIHYDGNTEYYMSTPGHTDGLGTGLAFEVPEGYVMLVFSRSGQGFSNAVRLSNCVGIIDSGYRNELFIKLRRDAGVGVKPLTVKKGDRIAQAMIIKFDAIEFIESDELSDSERGMGGLGHTGK
jgi:dUTP pyrophosphatase